MTTFKLGEEKRSELELPTLHFITMDQWIDVIGEKALFAWLKMYTWCDRKNIAVEEESTKWEQSKVKDSLQGVASRLGVGKGTFYNKILKPLWNVGLIDIEEWAQDPRSGQKAINIVVYKYPQNNKVLSFKPLKEIRDYDKEYSSAAKHFAKQKGQNKIDNPEEVSEKPKTEGAPEIKEETPVPKQNGTPFSNETVPRSETEHNKSLNSFNNSFNPFISSVNKDVHNEQLKIQRDIDKILNEYRLKGLSKELCIKVLEETKEKDGIENFPAYLRTCLENTLYKHNVKYGKVDPSEKMASAYEGTGIPFYNWLELKPMDQ